MIPEGVCVKTEKGYFYISGPKSRLRVTSGRILSSWHFDRVLEVPEREVANFLVLGKLPFRSGTVIRDYGSRVSYVISKGKRYRITSPDYFVKHGYGKRFKPVWVSTAEADLHKDGGDV